MTEKVSVEGPGFLSLLTLLFIGLKLTHYIDWQWFWVLSPLLIPLSLVCSFVIVMLLVLGIMSIINKIKYNEWI